MTDDASIVGRPHPKEIIEVTLLLRYPVEAPSVHELGACKPHERQHMSHVDFAASYGAAPEDVATVETFAKRHGFSVLETNAAHRTVRIAGDIESFSSVFNVDLVHHEHEQGVFRSHAERVHIPKELTAVVQSVFGFCEKPHAEPHFKHFADADEASLPKPEDTIHYTPPQLAELYGFPSDATGRGECIAVLAFGGGYVQEDLDRYFKGIGLQPPSVTAVSVGADNSPIGNPMSFDAEVMMDIEVAGGLAPGASIVVYFAPNDPQGWVNCIRKAVHDEVHQPSVISISWGAIEKKWYDERAADKDHFVEAVDQAFREAAMKGITVCVSSGDHGSADGEKQGAYVSFPASSPHVLCCGGTKLTASEGETGEEVVWNDLGGPMNAATGGGISDIFPLPAWQERAGVPLSANDGTTRGRGLPDVAANADPHTGYLVRVDGVNTVLGGTSAATPLWAALVARINESLGLRVGFLTPYIYTQLASRGVFREITQGGNGAYEACAGWNPCTGWGSPHGTKILEALCP